MKQSWKWVIGLSVLISWGGVLAEEILKELPEAAEIMKRYRSMPYGTTADKFEAVGEIPFCVAVLKRSQEESLEVIRAALKDKPSVSARLRDLELTGAPSRAPSRTVNADGKRPVFFFGDAKIQMLVQSGKGYQEKVGELKDVKVGDYVLSTTAHIVDDPGYQQRCWAYVSEKPESKLAGNAAVSVLLYQNKAGEQQNLLTTGDPKLSLYAKVRGQDNETWNPVSCYDLRLGTELYSPKEEGIEGRCQFAANYKQTLGKDGGEAYNLTVALTGAYFVGDLGAQILVQN